MVLPIQKYISNFKNVKDANTFLSSIFKIRVGVQNITFNSGMKETVYIYNKTALSPIHEIVTDANGLILNKDGDIVSFPFKNIYDFNASYLISEKEFTNARIEEMYDGTLVVVYKYKDTMFVQTKERVMGDSVISLSVIDTFRGLTETILFKLFGENYEDLFEPNKCYAFELTSQFTKNIVKYEKSSLMLLSIFDKDTCRELPKWEVDRFAFGRSDLKEVKLDRPKSTFIITTKGMSENIKKYTEILHNDIRGCVIVDNDKRFKVETNIFKSKNKINRGIDLDIIDFAILVLKDKNLIYDKTFKPIYTYLNNSIIELTDMVDKNWKIIDEKKHSLILSPIDVDILVDSFNLPEDLVYIITLLNEGIIKKAIQGKEYIDPNTLVAYTINYFDSTFIEICSEHGINIS
jgi:hypothetical protein